MRIPDSDRRWLEASGLVDAEVDLGRVRLHVAPPFSWYLRLRRLSALTIGNHIWFRTDERRADRALLVHELVHVGQCRRMGLVRFLAHYFRELAQAGFRYSRDLPLEAPAYARQAVAKERLREEAATPR